MQRRSKLKILIVEDDENKRSQIYDFVNSIHSSYIIKTARSLQSGLRAIIEGEINLIILDMTLPTFDINVNEHGGRPQAYAGREILRQMDRRNIHTPVIVVTQFDRFGEGNDVLTLTELDAQLKTAHSTNYKGSVYYNVTLEGWKEELRKLMHEQTNK